MAVTGAIVFFAVFALHATWVALRSHAENEIHEQMREARYFASRRHDPESKVDLRVGDDDELTDDLDEMDDELKPKRKRM